MVKYVGSWWIKDGLDGRRLEAEKFASTLGALSQFDWTQNFGDTTVVKKDFVTTAGQTQRTDSVDALQMSTHGWTDGFLVTKDSVTTGDAIDFGKNDLEFFASHACDLLEHSAAHPVWRWMPAFERLHYMLGFHNHSYSGGGQNDRGYYFALYAAYLYYAIPFFTIDMSIRDAWIDANELVEGSNVEWAYLRAETASARTYSERLREPENTDPVFPRTFYTSHGTC